MAAEWSAYGECCPTGPAPRGLRSWGPRSPLARRCPPPVIALQRLHQRLGVLLQPARALQYRRGLRGHLGAVEPLPQALVNGVRETARPAGVTRASPQVLVTDVERDLSRHKGQHTSSVCGACKRAHRPVRAGVDSAARSPTMSRYCGGRVWGGAQVRLSSLPIPWTPVRSGPVVNRAYPARSSIPGFRSQGCRRAYSSRRRRAETACPGGSLRTPCRYAPGMAAASQCRISAAQYRGRARSRRASPRPADLGRKARARAGGARGLVRRSAPRTPRPGA
jgi:hypothetical protein